MSNYIVETKGLTKNFKDFKAVNGIDLKVKEGTIYGFLGPNGAGKSTSLRMILGLIKPSEGDAFIFSRNIKDSREEILKNVGALIESPSYYGHLTAYENLEITRRILDLDKAEIIRVLDLVGLGKVKNKKVKAFSLGMKQRLGIAQALMGSPKLIILDEPTNGLDPSGIQEIRELIKSLAKKEKITVIISSHILSEIELMADEVGIIKNGDLIYQGTIENLRRNKDSNIVVEVSDKKFAMELLKKRNYKVLEDRHKLIVKGDGLTANRLCRELVLAGVDINYLSEEEKSLEDIFLNLTKEAKAC